MKYIRGCKINQIEIADDFYKAYERCLASDANGQYVSVPAFANGMFACELYFKSLLGSNIKEHNLKILFDSLDVTIRKELEAVKCDCEFSLGVLLGK